MAGADRRIGGRRVSAIGFGEAGLSVAARPSDEAGCAVLAAAYDAGITLFDTATCYVPSADAQGHGERLLASALAGRGDVVVASKAGIERTASVDFATDFSHDARPATVRRQCEASLRALGAERIDLYQLHRPDPNVPLAETMGAFAELRTEGKIDLVGLCNVTAAELEQALAIVDVASVQNSFSLANRESADLAQRCHELGIAFLAYSPLGGLGDRARSLPQRVPSLQTVASARGVSPHRVALAWLLAQGPHVIPLVGARRIETIRDSATAASLELTQDELETLAA